MWPFILWVLTYMLWFNYYYYYVWVDWLAWQRGFCVCVCSLTAPVLPRERWLICWVRGLIMDVGCSDMEGSIEGDITAPYKRTKRQEWHHSRTEQEMPNIQTGHTGLPSVLEVALKIHDSSQQTDSFFSTDNVAFNHSFYISIPASVTDKLLPHHFCHKKRSNTSLRFLYSCLEAWSL